MNIPDMFEDLPGAVAENLRERLERGEEIEVSPGYYVLDYLVDTYQFLNDYSPHMWLEANCIYPRAWGRRMDNLDAILEKRGYVAPPRSGAPQENPPQRSEALDRAPHAPPGTFMIRAVLHRPDRSLYDQMREAILKQEELELEGAIGDFEPVWFDALLRMVPAGMTLSHSLAQGHPRAPGFQMSLKK